MLFFFFISYTFSLFWEYIFCFILIEATVSILRVFDLWCSHIHPIFLIVHHERITHASGGTLAQ